MHKKLEKCRSKQIGHFVKTCEACLLLDDDGTKSTVLQKLDSVDGVQILRNMYGTPKKFVLRRAATAMQVSLIEDLFPMLKLVTSTAMLNTVLQNCVNGFLQALGHCFDWKLLHPLLDEYLAEQGSLAKVPQWTEFQRTCFRF